MQAASINVQPAPQAPQTGGPRESSPANAGLESRGGLSFQAILSRSLRDSLSPEDRAAPKSKPAGEMRQGAAAKGSNGKTSGNPEAEGSVGSGEPRRPGAAGLRGNSKDGPPKNPEISGSAWGRAAEDAEALPGSKELSRQPQKTGISPEGAEPAENRPKVRERRQEASPRAEESVAQAIAPSVPRTPSSDLRGHDPDAKAP